MSELKQTFDTFKNFNYIFNLDKRTKEYKEFVKALKDEIGVDLLYFNKEYKYMYINIPEMILKYSPVKDYWDEEEQIEEMDNDYTEESDYWLENGFGVKNGFAKITQNLIYDTYDLSQFSIKIFDLCAIIYFDENIKRGRMTFIKSNKTRPTYLNKESSYDIEFSTFLKFTNKSFPIVPEIISIEVKVPIECDFHNENGEDAIASVEDKINGYCICNNGIKKYRNDYIYTDHYHKEIFENNDEIMEAWWDFQSYLHSISANPHQSTHKCGHNRRCIETPSSCFGDLAFSMGRLNTIYDIYQIIYSYSRPNNDYAYNFWALISKLFPVSNLINIDPDNINLNHYCEKKTKLDRKHAEKCEYCEVTLTENIFNPEILHIDDSSRLQRINEGRILDLSVHKHVFHNVIYYKYDFDQFISHIVNYSGDLDTLNKNVFEHQIRNTSLLERDFTIFYTISYKNDFIGGYIIRFSSSDITSAIYTYKLLRYTRSLYLKPLFDIEQFVNSSQRTNFETFFKGIILHASTVVSDIAKKNYLRQSKEFFDDFDIDIMEVYIG